MKLLCNICLEEIKGKVYSCNQCIQGHLDDYVCNLNSLCKDCYKEHQLAHERRKDNNACVVIDMNLNVLKKKSRGGNGTFF